MSDDKIMTIDELKDFRADVSIECATRSALEISRDDWDTTMAVLRRLVHGHAYAEYNLLDDDDAPLPDEVYGGELSDRMWDLKLVMMEAYGGLGGVATEFDDMGPRTDELDIDNETREAIHDVNWLIRRGQYVLSRLLCISDCLTEGSGVYEHPEVIKHINEEADEFNWHRVVDTFVEIAKRACGGAGAACQRIMNRHRNLHPDDVVDINGVLLWSRHARLLGFSEEVEKHAAEMKEAQRSLAARGLIVQDPEDGRLRLTAYGLEESIGLLGIGKSKVARLYKAMTPKPKGNVTPIR